MEMKKRKIYEEKEVTMYVAFDGKEFDQMNSCEAYEEVLIDKLLDESPDIVKNDEAEGDMPFGGIEYSENNAFKWVKPLNEKGVELLNRLFPNSFSGEFDINDVGKWICLEISDDDVYCSSLESNLEYVTNMCKKFGINISIGSCDMVVELCPNCSREVEMRWNTKEDGYKAFCPYCGKELMLCDDCLHRDENDSETDKSCNYDRQSGNCRFKDSEYEYILNFANSGTFDYKNNNDLKTLRVLWTAYCLHKDYDADTANYDSGISEIFSKLGEKTADFEEKGFERFDRYMCKYLV